MITRLYVKRSIAAAHYLPDYDGSCGHLHGHTWVIEVWIEGPADPTTGMVVDFREVKEIIDYCDHQTLNLVLPEGFLPPTAENLARYFYGAISCSVQVRVWESENCYAECRSERRRFDAF